MDDIIDITKSDKPLDLFSEDTQDNKRLLDMQEQIKALCTNLYSNSRNFNCANWVKQLTQYINKYDRILYSNISSLLFALSDENFDILLTNLDAVMNFTISHYREGESTRKVVLKFYDHANLARQQYIAFNQKNDEIESLIEKKINPALSKTTKELTSQLVGLVAIFTALSFIVFGGITSLNGIFTNLSDTVDIASTLLIVLLWTFGMLNFLFTFMYFVIKITNGLSLKSNEASSNFVKRHPLICICDGILMSMILICSFIILIRKYGFGEIAYAFFNKNVLALCLGILILIIMILCLWMFLVRQYKKQ